MFDLFILDTNTAPTLVPAPPKQVSLDVHSFGDLELGDEVDIEGHLTWTEVDTGLARGDDWIRYLPENRTISIDPWSREHIGSHIVKIKVHDNFVDQPMSTLYRLEIVVLDDGEPWRLSLIHI